MLDIKNVYKVRIGFIKFTLKWKTSYSIYFVSGKYPLPHVKEELLDPIYLVNFKGDHTWKTYRNLNGKGLKRFEQIKMRKNKSIKLSRMYY